MPIDGVLKMHFDDVFHTMYRRCGWSISNNKQGRPITLADLYEAVLEVSAAKNLQYDDEVRKNIFGAMLARVKMMMRNPALVRMLNTTQGISIPELLNHTSVFILDNLSESDKILVTGLLTAAVSEYRMANPLPELRNLLIIEESHYLLGQSLETGADEPDHSTGGYSDCDRDAQDGGWRRTGNSPDDAASFVSRQRSEVHSC